MKRRYSKLLAIILALVIMFSVLAGCGKEIKQPDNSTAGSSTAVQQSSTVVKAEPVKIKMFTGFGVPNELLEGDKALLEQIEKANNVKLEFEVPPETNYNERLQLMLASGEYPDIVTFASHTDPVFQNAVDNGVIIPITKYIENAPNIKKYTYSISFDAMKAKGDTDIYAIPKTSILRADGFIVRKDWLDNVGLSIPEDGAVTLDEFTEILKRFTINDPDKNGKKDTYGMTDYVDANGNLNTKVEMPFGLLGWQKSTGKYEYLDPKFSKEDVKYKNALEYAAKIYKAGYVNPNVIMNKAGDTTIARVIQGSVGVVGEFAGWMYKHEIELKKLNPNASFMYLSGIKNKDGIVQGSSGSAGTGSGAGFWTLHTITKSCKNPETVVKMFDWMLSDEGWDKLKYGIEGVTYTKKDNAMEATDAYTKFALGTALVRRNNDPQFFVKLNIPKSIRPIVEKNIGNCIKQVVPGKDRGYKPPIATDQKFIEGNKKLGQVITKIIVGSLPVSAYDAALDEWYKAGGEQYIQEMNEFIKKSEVK